MAFYEQQDWNNAAGGWHPPASFNPYAPPARPRRTGDPTRTSVGSLMSQTGLSPTGSGPAQMDRSRNASQSSNGVDWNTNMSEASPPPMGTPDNKSFEQELIQGGDETMLNFYHAESVNGNILRDPEAMDLSPFETSSQEVEYAFTATMPFAMPEASSLQVPINGNGQAYEQTYPLTYAQQLPQHGPWNTHYLRSPMGAGSEAVVFDPEHNHVNYPAFNDGFNIGVNPTLFDPPPTVPDLGDQFLFEQHISHVQMALPDAMVNDFTFGQDLGPPQSNYVPQTSSQGSPAPTSTIAHTRDSSCRGSASPHIAAQSPESDTMMSSRTSDAGLTVDPMTMETFNPSPSPAPAPKVDSIPDSVMFGPPEAPEPSEGPQRSRQRRAQLHNRPGGRQLGSHLKPDVAKDAHDMRKVVACWHCVLQRDKCGPGEICERCVKRSQRPNTDTGLGCSRVKLVELTYYFLPTVMTSIHEDASLTNFVHSHIHQWSNIEVSLKMTCGKGMPPLNCKVYEFIPSTNELLRQFQYRTNPQTQQRIRVEKKSPPLGMMQLNHTDEKKYDKYVNEIVDSYIDAFGDLFWKEDNNDFQVKLFKLMTQLHPASEDEAKLHREIMRLMVVTFIMGHVLTIVEDSKEATLSRLHSYSGPGEYVENFCSPRMTNRQLKYFFCRLHRNIMQNVLNKLQQIFKSSRGCDKWTSAFCAVLGLAMAHEDNQKTIHLVMETKAASGEMSPQNAQLEGDYACREIDNKFGFIASIFRWKYNRSCNPLRDSEHDWSSKLKDESALAFVKSVANLVRENTEFLSDRRRVGISCDNSIKYTSRLTADFLLSFWLPSA